MNINKKECRIEWESTVTGKKGHGEYMNENLAKKHLEYIKSKTQSENWPLRHWLNYKTKED